MHELLELAPSLWLTGDGGAWLPASRALVVADVHVGYELAAQRRDEAALARPHRAADADAQSAFS